MRRHSIPAFTIACALRGVAPAPPPQPAAPMNLHASMATNAFLTIRRTVILLAVKRAPYRYCCNAIFSPIHVSCQVVPDGCIIAASLLAAQD